MKGLFHCFGANPDHIVDTGTAVDMLRASECRYLAVNTHSVYEVGRGDDLPVGYATATLGSVTEAAGKELGLHPVLNINHPTSAQEAVARTRAAVDLTGIQVIKLEVLDQRLTVSQNAEVVAAARELVDSGLEVWPLITPEASAFRSCVETGCTMVRVMGSPIGSRRGIAPERMPTVRALLAEASVPIMLDGGIGSEKDIRTAIRLGFDSFLVNSLLFAPETEPVEALKRCRAIINKELGNHGEEN